VRRGAFAVAALLTNIFQRKRARNPYVRLVDVSEETTDAAPWGMNWSREYDAYKRTVDVTHTRFGGSEALPEEKIERDPWLKRMFAGYAFAIDYRDRRGHAYMLSDQEMTKRVTERSQPGSCLHCHSAVIPTYRRLGDGDVFKGFEVLGKMSYADAHAEVAKTGSSNPVAGGTSIRFEHADGAHPVSCIDCHDPRTMDLRVTRPGFILGIRELATSGDPVPHLPSMQEWREGDRSEPYDPNALASRQEMRAFVCGQCHVEYYFQGEDKQLVYPWDGGVAADEICVLRGRGLLRLGARDQRRQASESAAPEFRCGQRRARALGRGVRRLPYALPARGRDEDQKPSGSQPAVGPRVVVRRVSTQRRRGARRSRGGDPGQHAPGPRPGGGATADLIERIAAAEEAGATRCSRRAASGGGAVLHGLRQRRLDGVHSPQEATRCCPLLDAARQGVASIGR
jgi:hypothetical protein